MFDEQPDGDPHGECAEEIANLRHLLGLCYAKMLKFGVENSDPLLMDELKLELTKLMGPSAIGAQPPPEDYDEEWLMMQEDEEGDEPFCNCTTGHGIEETDWNQCDSCGKPIYDEDEA